MYFKHTWTHKAAADIKVYFSVSKKDNIWEERPTICYTIVYWTYELHLRGCFLVAMQPKIGSLIVEVLRSHTIRQTQTPGSTTLDEWSAHRRGRYLNNTQQTQESDIHALSDIRTRDPNNRVAADPRLWPHGHRDRLRVNFDKHN